MQVKWVKKKVRFNGERTDGTFTMRCVRLLIHSSAIEIVFFDKETGSNAGEDLQWLEVDR